MTFSPCWKDNIFYHFLNPIAVWQRVSLWCGSKGNDYRWKSVIWIYWGIRSRHISTFEAIPQFHVRFFIHNCTSHFKCYKPCSIFVQRYEFVEQVGAYGFVNATNASIDIFTSSYSLYEGRAKIVVPTFVTGESR